MFKLSQHTFGSFTACKLASLQGANIVFVPEYGANVIGLQLGQCANNLLDTYPSAIALKQHNWAKSAWLVPFPNRVKHGRYQFEGKTYQLPINHQSEGHAIHGFVYDKPFSIVSTKKEAANSGKVIFCYQYHGQFAYYPFPFMLAISYQLQSIYSKYIDTLQVTASLTNIGTGNMPVGIGWHPYFMLPGATTANQYRLHLPKAKQIIVENMIPTGALAETASFNGPVNNTHFDTGFKLLNEKEINSSISYGNSQLVLKQHFTQQHTYLQVFVPPKRHAIALEPMSCAANSFNNNMGLKVLPPEGTFQLICSLSLVQAK